MKSATVFLLLLLPILCFAEQGIYRDSSGGYAGSSSGLSDRNPFIDEED
jgi:hypothetical protein